MVCWGVIQIGYVVINGGCCRFVVTCVRIRGGFEYVHLVVIGLRGSRDQSVVTVLKVDGFLEGCDCEACWEVYGCLGGVYPVMCWK